MNVSVAQRKIQSWDAQGKYVFSRHFLRRLFPEDSDRAFNKGLARLVEQGILERVCRGVYRNPLAVSRDGYGIEHAAIALRPGHYNYVSLESALSEYGIISQIPMDTLTVMTTGRKGIYPTTMGAIELTHTMRATADILNGIVRVPGRPLRLATPETAWRDLKRVGRNTHLVDQRELHDVANAAG